jgi:magnesium-transporting ATPase (P-type)
MASVNFNMNNNSDLGDINNCNSLNSSVVSSPIVNSIRRNSFYKLTNVLLLLFFLLFGSSVVSFGSDTAKENDNEEKKENKQDENKSSFGKYLLLYFAPGLITGIGGYDNKWKPLNENWGLHWFRSNLWLAYGLNKHIYDSNYIDVDLHIFGINFLSFLENIIIKYAIKCDYIAIVNKYDVGIPKANDNYFYIGYFMWLFVVHIFQILDFEIKVFKYWSISLNFTVVVLNLFYIIRHKIITYVTK